METAGYIIVAIGILSACVVILAILAPSLALALINAIERVLLAFLAVPRGIAEKFKKD